MIGNSQNGLPARLQCKQLGRSFEHRSFALRQPAQAKLSEDVVTLPVITACCSLSGLSSAIVDHCAQTPCRRARRGSWKYDGSHNKEHVRRSGKVDTPKAGAHPPRLFSALCVQIAPITAKVAIMITWHNPIGRHSQCQSSFVAIVPKSYIIGVAREA